MVAPLKVGIAGLGTVGADVVRLLQQQNRTMVARCGRGVRVVAVSARSRVKKRGLDLKGIDWAKNALAIANDPRVDCFVELMGGAGDPALRRALLADLIAAPELDPNEIRRRVEAFAHGAQTMEAALYVLDAFARSSEARLERLEPRQRRLLERRVLARESWRSAAAAAGYPDVPTAMRALRPAVRRLIER